MPYNYAAKSFCTKTLCSRFYSREIQFYTKNDQFLSHPLEGLKATYAVHTTLIGKPVVDCLLVINKLFSLDILSLMCYERISIEN